MRTRVPFSPLKKEDEVSRGFLVISESLAKSNSGINSNFFIFLNFMFLKIQTYKYLRDRFIVKYLFYKLFVIFESNLFFIEHQ